MIRKDLSVCLLALIIGPVGLWGFAGGTVSPLLSPDDYQKLVQQDSKALKELLEKIPLDEKTNRKAKGTAMLLAGYGQSQLSVNQSGGAVALRDSSLKLIQLLEKNSYPEAKLIAGNLSLNMKPLGTVNSKPIPLNKAVEFDVVMRLFSRTGYGLERDLDEAGELKTFSPEQLEKLNVLGNKLAVIAEISHDYVPEKDEGKKTKKNWLDFSGQFKSSSLQLVKAAKEKNNNQVGDSISRISASCRKCHEVFRDE